MQKPWHAGRCMAMVQCSSVLPCHQLGPVHEQGGPHECPTAATGGLGGPHVGRGNVCWRNCSWRKSSLCDEQDGEEGPTSSMVVRDVPGLSTTPAFTPRSLICAQAIGNERLFKIHARTPVPLLNPCARQQRPHTRHASHFTAGIQQHRRTCSPHPHMRDRAR